MAEPSSSAEIAREVLRRLTTRRIQPTPENFSKLYHEIAGTTPEEIFPERNFRQIATALPRATNEQLRVARQFETACAEGDWAEFRQQLMDLLAVQQEEPLAWGNLIRDLQSQTERRQLGLNSVTKREALSRVIESSASDPTTLFSRLQGLIRGWAQLPAAASVEVEMEATDATREAATPSLPDLAPAAGLEGAPAPWRELLAGILESAVGMLLVDTPELSREASALARQLRTPEPGDEDDFSARLHQFAYKVQWISQDQSYIRNALLNLLRLIIENIGELVIDDKYLQGQMNVLLELFARPLDKGVIEELGERLRDVIYKQGTLKRSLTDAQNRLRDMLATFVGQLGELAESTGAYHGKVSAFAEQLAKASSLSEMAGLVDNIVKETRAVETSARHSQEELQNLRVTVDEAHKEISRLEGELEQASKLVRHDPLTGTLNRKGLDEILTRELARMRRRGSKLSLALLDVDDFKKLNDTLGHLTGDEALKHLAQVIRENIRPQDSAGRYGGEEFLILLPDTGQDDGVNAIRRLQRELTKRIFMHENQRVLITFSAGVTEVIPEEEVKAAIGRADKAMYQAKKSGKNRVASA